MYPRPNAYKTAVYQTMLNDQAEREAVNPRPDSYVVDVYTTLYNDRAEAETQTKRADGYKTALYSIHQAELGGTDKQAVKPRPAPIKKESVDLDHLEELVDAVAELAPSPRPLGGVSAAKGALASGSGGLNRSMSMENLRDIFTPQGMIRTSSAQNLVGMARSGSSSNLVGLAGKPPTSGTGSQASLMGSQEAFARAIMEKKRQSQQQGTGSPALERVGSLGSMMALQQLQKFAS